jgi:hypothetical protein
MKNLLVAVSIVFALISVPDNSASATEVCLAEYKDSEWRDGQPAGVKLSPDLILAKVTSEVVNLNGEYFKRTWPNQLSSGSAMPTNFGSGSYLASQSLLLNSTSKTRIQMVYEGKACATRTVQFEIGAIDPSVEFSLADLDVWAKNLRVPDVIGPLNFKEIALAKEIFLKAREYIAKNPRVTVKYRDLESAKKLTTDYYRGNERNEFPQSTISDYIQSLISSEYKLENPAFLKNLKYIFLQLKAYSPDGCIRFHTLDLVQKQGGYETENSYYSPNMFSFYHFPKKQDCNFNLVYFSRDYDQVIPLGEIILQPIIDQSKSILGKKALTITCIKGKTTKKVTAVNPKCPTGYKKK